LIPKSDCTGYYICVNSQPIEMPDCPSGSVFSRNAHVCVPKGSYFDDCSEGTIDTRPDIPDLGPLSIAEQCSMHGGLIPHPDECQTYYNCSHKYEQVPTYYEQHMMECPYPELFNTKTMSCDHFENVQCDKRKEVKNGCDYKRNQCPVSHCIPCYIRFPSCEGLPNGQNPHLSKPWSPYYVMCYDSRMVKESLCPADKDGRTQLFHPEVKACVGLDMIPKEHGGMMPDCRGKPDGFYPDDFGRCTQYTACKGGEFLNYVKCMGGEVYDALMEVCMEPELACGACGQRTNCR